MIDQLTLKQTTIHKVLSLISSLSETADLESKVRDAQNAHLNLKATQKLKKAKIPSEAVAQFEALDQVL